MILKILLILIFCIILLIGVIVFSPIYFTYNNKKKPYNAAVLVMHIIHPRIMRLTYVFSFKKYEMLFLNRFRIGSLKKEEPLEPAEEDSEREEEMEEIKPEEEEPYLKDKADISEEKGETEKETIERAVDKPEPAAPHIPPKPEKEPEKELEKEQKGEGLKSVKEIEEPPKSTFRKKFNKFKMILQFILNQKKIAGKAMKWLQKFLQRCLRLISFDYLSMRIKAGFTDPAITGTLHGFFTGMYHGLDIRENGHFFIDFEPQFEEEDIFLFEGAVRIKISLAQLLRPVFIGLLTFPYISAFILWRRIRKFKSALKQQ